MWVNKQLFNRMLNDSAKYLEAAACERVALGNVTTLAGELRSQKVKDDLTIDWMRHRVNALEKERAQLLLKVGIHFPVPELVSTRPGTMSELPDFDFTPSFESLSDAEAARLGITHDEAGHIVYAERT